MSNETQKADQIAFHLYTKLFYVVNHARATTEPRVQPKTDKWFNLETPDSDLFTKDVRDKYRFISTYPPPPPPLEIQVLLSIPELTNNQVLVYLSPDSSRVRIEPTPRHIVLESWVLSFTPRDIDEEDGVDVAPPTIYKHGIPLFRSLFSLLRILPAWKLYKRLRRRTGVAKNGNLSVQLRVRGSNSLDDSSTILGFDTPPSANIPPLPTQSHEFPSVPHLKGTLSLSTTYLTSPNFQLDELESLLSSRFLSLDEGPEFMPTLAKNQQRDSISSSPGSLPIRTSLPKSPPSSVADRFILPSRPSSGVGVSPRNVPLPISRYTSSAAATGGGSASGISTSSHSRQDSISGLSRDDMRPLSGIAARLRKESTGSGRGADLPSAPSPLPIRRPSINPVHPFKSSTLSSGSATSHHSPSPSLRQASPLATVGLPSRPLQTSPTSSRVPPSPIGIGNRPSPPFPPSSLGERRSPAGGGDGDDPSRSQAPVPVRKRYSSSFGHRYAATGGAGSDGSAGSGERRDGERVGSASFLSNNTDDDDISAFVQDIDSRKPLSGQQRIRDEGHGLSHDRDTTSGEGKVEADRPEEQQRGGDAVNRPVIGSSPQGPMLTSESEVDERLRRMNEAFLASLEGLGGGGAAGQAEGSVRSRDRDRQRGVGEDNNESSRSGRGGENVIRRESSNGLEGLGISLGGTRDRDRDYARGRGSPFGGRPRHGSTSTNVSEGVSQGSEEIIGKMELDDGRRRNRGQYK